jgi:hypothetical protein
MKTDNELIAEFMGYKVIDDGISKFIYYTVLKFECGRRQSYRTGAKGVVQIANLYNTSWDWLMPVVERIRTTIVNNHSVAVVMEWTDGFRANQQSKAFCQIETYISDFSFTKDEMIEATHKAVVEFIKWYNENK